MKQALIKAGKESNLNATIKKAQAVLERMNLDLHYTKVYSPATGSLVKMVLRPGDWVTKGQNIFALIEDNSWWVAANFKETNLARIKPLMRCEIKLDMYSNHIFKGYVTKISKGSTASFSILPAQSTTGNFVKIVHRFPVEVFFSVIIPANFPLRVGVSATVTALFFHNALGYPPLLTGLLVITLMIGSLVSSFILTFFTKYFACDKVFVFIGIICAIVGDFMLADLNANASPEQTMIPLFLMGSAVTFTHLTLENLLYEGNPDVDVITDQVGLLELFAALLAYFTQANWHNLTAHIDVYNPNFHNWLASRDLQLHSVLAAPSVAVIVAKKANLLAYLHIPFHSAR